jgi:hypothetical protein
MFQRAPSQLEGSRKTEHSSSTPVEPCQIDRVADVELQLILQPLTNKERIIAARVCRRMLSNANQSFAWKCAERFRLFSGHVEKFSRLGGTLIHHAPIEFVWQTHLNDSQLPLVPPIVKLVSHQASVIAEPFWNIQCRSLLQAHNSTLQTLVALGRQILDSSTMRLLPSLAHVQTMALSCTPRCARNFLTPLAECHFLTDLTVKCEHYSDPHPCLGAISGCQSIKKLTLVNFAFSEGDFRRVLGSAALSTLIELSLIRTSAIPLADLEGFPTSDDWHAVFQNLQMLERLSLSASVGIAAMLLHVPLLRTLKQLHLNCNSSKNPGLWDRAPARADLETILQVCPNLHVRVMVIGSLDAWLSRVDGNDMEMQDIVRQEWEEVQQMHTLFRMTVLIKGEDEPIDELLRC